MSTLIRMLSRSRLAEPRVAVAVSGAGLLLGMLVGATAPNFETLPRQARLPLSHLLPSLRHDTAAAITMLYAGDILACLGLAAMLWAHSRGWRPDPRRLVVVSAAIVAVMVSITPVGSSDTASYAAYGRIAALGGDPYTMSPAALGRDSPYLHVLGITFLRGGAGHLGKGAGVPYLHAVGALWKNQPSVYGPLATGIQAFAASVGGTSAATTVWILMILNGLAFIGIGLLLLKTANDPVRATLFWTANPVLIQQLVSGGHLDTFVAAGAIAAIQVARRFRGTRGDLVTGVLIGLGCGIKISAALIGLGLAWPLLRRHEWARTARIGTVAVATLALQYVAYGGVAALHQTLGGASFVSLPSPWWFLLFYGEAFGVHATVMTMVINMLWPVAMLAIAWLVYRRISSDQPAEVVACFAIAYAWILAAPWAFPWYTALPWVVLALLPRNRMTRWLAIVTVFLAITHSSGGGPPGHPIFVQMLRDLGVAPS